MASIYISDKCKYCEAEKLHDQNWCPQVTCKDCEGKGHTQYVCPKAICYRCDKTGHKAYHCRENKRSRGRERQEKNERRPERRSEGKRKASDLLREFREFDADGVTADIERQIDETEKDLADLEMRYTRERAKLEKRRKILYSDLEDHKAEASQIQKLQKLLEKEEEEQSEAALLGEKEEERENI